MEINELVSEGPPHSESMSGRILRNSLWHSAGWVALLLLNIVSVPIIIGALGPDSYGLFVLVMSVAAPMGLLDLGMTDATVKFVSESLGTGDTKQASKYSGSAMLFNLVVGCIGMSAIALIAPILVTGVFDIPSEHMHDAVDAVRLSGVVWMSTQIRQTPIGLITAHKRFDILTLGSTLTQAGIIFIGLVALWSGLGLVGFVGAQAIGSVVATIAWIYSAVRLSRNISLSPSYEPRSLRQTIRFGVWQMLNMFGSMLSQQSLRWLLGILLSVVSVGLYNICQQLVSTLYMVAFRAGQVLFPEVSALEGRGEKQRSAEIAVRSTWLVSLAATALFVPLAVFAPDVLRLWVGESISVQAALTLRIVCAGAFVGCLFAVPSFFLLGTDRGRLLAGMSFANGIVVVSVSALLVPRWGLEGAALAYVAGTSVHAFMLLYVWRTIFRTWVKGPVFAASAFGSFIISLILVFLGIYLKTQFQYSVQWIGLAVSGASTSVIAVSVLLLIDRILPGGAERSGTIVKILRGVRLSMKSRNVT